MTSILRFSLLLIVPIAMFTSCKRSAPKQTRHIPKNASFVASINTKEIKNKLVKSQATIENLFKSMAGDTSLNKGKKEWEEFQESGIDLDENFFISVVQKGGGMTNGKGTMVTTGIGGLKDAGKLEAYIKKKQPEAEIRKEKDYSYASLEGNNSMVAWANDLVIIMSHTRSSANQMEYDSTTGEFNFKQPANTAADDKAEMAAYFNLKEDQSVASIPEFRDLMKDNADGSFWINSAASVEDMPIPLPKVKDLLQNNFSAATLNFEDGKIVVDSKSYSSPALQDLFKKYPGPATDLSLIERYPSNNVNGFMSLAFNPEIINGIVNFLELRAMADNYIKQAFGGTYSLDDIVKAIKGDIAVVVSDFSMPSADSTRAVTPFTMPAMKMVMNIPVGDASHMNKLMDKLVEMQLMVKNGNTYVATEALSRTSNYRLVADDKNVLMASDDETLNKYKAAASKATLPGDVMGDFKGKAGAFYVNIESILNGIPVQSQDQEMNKVMPMAKSTFKDMRASVDKFEGKYTEGHFELRFKNEKENSLVSLLQFLGVVGENVKKPRMMDIEDMRIDSTNAYSDTIALPQ
jgi:hypothetical protein